MPSPFPGMDPYFEGNWWTSFHAEFASNIAHQLVPQLRPKYIAVPERRYIRGAEEEVLISAAAMIPDVAIRRTKSHAELPAATATITEPVRLRTSRAIKVPQYRVEIRDLKNRRLVTAIELLSPTNKGSGRKSYLRKRRHLLWSSTNLMKIDLHHQGRRIPLLDPYPPATYYVLLNRARKRSVTEVWPIKIDEPLPTVSIPLLKGDADVPLNLQRAFTHVYDAGGFDLAHDYREAPDVELPVMEAAWLAEHLKQRGFRKTK
jgi:hypothetical protein